MYTVTSYRYDGDEGTKTGLVRAVEATLDCADYESGELETIRRDINRLREFTGMLIEMLLQKDSLTTQQVKELLETSYYFRKVTITHEPTE